MTLKEEGIQSVIDAQEGLIKNLKEEIRLLCRRNLQLREHMKVIITHPVSLATSMICRKYSREKVTKELQLSTQN